MVCWALGTSGVILDGCWCPGDLLVGGDFDGGLVGGAGLGVDEADVFGSFVGSKEILTACDDHSDGDGVGYPVLSLPRLHSLPTYQP